MLPTPSEELPNLPWYIIHTHSRYEVMVEAGQPVFPYSIGKEA
ncbi:MAG: hypothetical protein WC600_12600 [Desulfobaccales bacterium]